MMVFTVERHISRAKPTPDPALRGRATPQPPSQALCPATTQVIACGAAPAGRECDPMTHVDTFFQQVARIATGIDRDAIERLAQELRSLRERGGRLFVLGVGGSAGNCSHAVNDFRKLCGIEAYAPVDNVSELTARANDEGWETIFTGWLDVSRANAKDAILVFSVGGGDAERNVSMNIVRAVDMAQRARAQGVRHRRPRHRPHGETWRHRNCHPGRRSGADYAAFGSFPGGGVALPGLAPGTADQEDQMVSGGRAAVFLDRDGVLNRAIVRNGRPYPPASLPELEILPGVPQAVARLRRGRLPDAGRDQSARCGDRQDDAGRRRPNTRSPARNSGARCDLCLHMRGGAGLRLLQAAPGNAHSRGSGMGSRLPQELHDRGPLARCGSRQGCGLPYDLHRL